MLTDIVLGKLDILLLSETKIDDSFSTEQFKIPGFSIPFRLDRSYNAGGGPGLLLYIRSDIPSKLLNKVQVPLNTECIFTEINLYKRKWLLGGIYNPNKSNSTNYLNILSKCLDHYMAQYDNVILLGDFNLQPTEHQMIEFCNLCNLKNIVNDSTKIEKSIVHRSYTD